MKSLLACAALVAAFSWPASAWEIGAMNRLIDETNFVIGSGRGHCSGTLIDVERRLIVTAYHCIDGNIKVRTEERTEDGEPGVKEVRVRKTDPVEVKQYQYDGARRIGAISYITEIVADNKKRDLAVLKLRGDNLLSDMAAPLLPDGETVTRGEPVWSVGNPYMQDASVAVGIVSATARTADWGGDDEVPMVQFSAGAAPGSSGGAVFNDRGQYIATIVGGFNGVGDVGFGVPVSELHALLKKAKLHDEVEMARSSD